MRTVTLPIEFGVPDDITDEELEKSILILLSTSLGSYASDEAFPDEVLSRVELRS